MIERVLVDLPQAKDDSTSRMLYRLYGELPTLAACHPLHAFHAIEGL